MLTVHTLPAFNDNYFWLIQPNKHSKDCFIVDPGDAQVVRRSLQTQDLNLKAVLITHHHHDHIDGATELSEQFQIPIFGPRSEKIPMVTQFLFETDRVKLSEETSAQIIEVPGHTKDHIAYYIEGESPKLFSGDTIFSAGCGRIFDGDSESLFHSIEKIKKLSPSTKIYAAHEYTLANLRFAQHIEPTNTEIQIRKQAVEQLRERKEPSLPTLLEAELQFNPFLRSHIDAVRERVSQLSGVRCASSLEVFVQMRKLKDHF